MLERLASVKAFILLVDLDERLVLQLFNDFFGMVSSAHSNSVLTHILDIMVACVEESEDISQEMLDVLLKPLTSPHKKDAPIAYKLAQNLINRCADVLQPPLTGFINSMIDGDNHVAEAALRDSYHEIIFELNKINSSLLISILPNLEKELIVEDSGKKKNVLLHFFDC